MGRDTLKLGDVFKIGNEDKPPWLKGWWRVIEVDDSTYRLERVKEKLDGLRKASNRHR